jgi:hypothetical protein
MVSPELLFGKGNNMSQLLGVIYRAVGGEQIRIQLFRVDKTQLALQSFAVYPNYIPFPLQQLIQRYQKIGYMIPERIELFTGLLRYIYHRFISSILSSL